MKAFYFAVAGCCISIAGYSQTNDTLLNRMPQWYGGILSPKPIWLGENKVGNIYSLPLDRMPCMVPDLKNLATIPTKKLYPGNSKMPNKTPG